MKKKAAYYDSPVGLVEILADKDKIVGLHFKEEKCYQEAANSVLLTAKKQLAMIKHIEQLEMQIIKIGFQ